MSCYCYSDSAERRIQSPWSDSQLRPEDCANRIQDFGKAGPMENYRQNTVESDFAAFY